MVMVSKTLLFPPFLSQIKCRSCCVSVDLPPPQRRHLLRLQLNSLTSLLVYMSALTTVSASPGSLSLERRPSPSCCVGLDLPSAALVCQTPWLTRFWNFTGQVALPLLLMTTGWTRAAIACLSGYRRRILCNFVLR